MLVICKSDDGLTFVAMFFFVLIRSYHVTHRVRLQVVRFYIVRHILHVNRSSAVLSLV